MPNDRSAGCRAVVYATYTVGRVLLPFFSYSPRPVNGNAIRTQSFGCSRPFHLEQAVLAAAYL